MCMTAFSAFDTKNAQDNGTMLCFQPPVVISVPNQATGMTATAVQLIQWQVRRDFSVNFRCYPLEAFKISCYHNKAI